MDDFTLNGIEKEIIQRLDNKLSYYDNVDTEEFNGELFVHVW